MILASPGSPAVIAHRGGAGYAPENTLAAFRRTLELGSTQWIEFDVQRSGDGELFVFHDADLRRTTDVERIYPDRADAGIGAFTAAELSRLDAGSWFDPSRFAGEQVPTLSETLELLNGNCGILLELKNGRLYPGIEEQAAAELRRHGLDGSPQVSVWSFDLDVLERFHSAMPSMAIGAFGGTVREIQQAARPAVLSAVGTWPDLSEEDVHLARSEDMPLVATTLNSISRMLQAIERGVDGIVTDYPDVLHDAVAHVEPFPADGRLIMERVRRPGGPSERLAVIRNAGPETLDLTGWYLRHGALTSLPAGPLRPDAHVEIPFSLSAKDALRDSPLPLALHDPGHRLIDLVEF